MRARLAARPPHTKSRWLALIGETVRERAHQVACVIVILVVAPILAGEQHVYGVVKIIVPLCPVMPGGRVLVRREQARAIVAVLENEVDVAAARAGEGADRKAQVAQYVR